MLVIRHSFHRTLLSSPLRVFVYLLFFLRDQDFSPWYTYGCVFWLSLNLNILNLQAVESREIPTLMDYMDRTRQTGILHLSHLKERNIQLTCSLPTWTFGNPAHSSRIDINIPFRVTGFCMPSFPPESLLSPWLVSDDVLHLFAQIMRSKVSQLHSCPGPQWKPEPFCIRLPFVLGESKVFELRAVSKGAMLGGLNDG